MLVLSRRVGESLVIGDEITITVLEFRGDVIRIGVDAPRHIQVRRQELLVELVETNRAAASPTAGAVAGLSRHVSGSAPVPANDVPANDVAAGEASVQEPVTRPAGVPGPRPGPPPTPVVGGSTPEQPPAADQTLPTDQPSE